MEINYIWRLVIENIDSFNISIIAGVITSIFIILVDSTANNVKLNHKGFYDDKYRRFQKMRRLIHMIDTIKSVFLLTENMDVRDASIKKLIQIQSLESIKREYVTEHEIIVPYRYFKDMYITDNMMEIIKNESDCYSKIRGIISANDINDFDLASLVELRTELWQIAFDMRRESIKKVSLEIVRELLRNNLMKFILIIIVIGFLIG